MTDSVFSISGHDLLNFMVGEIDDVPACVIASELVDEAMEVIFSRVQALMPKQPGEDEEGDANRNRFLLTATTLLMLAASAKERGEEGMGIFFSFLTKEQFEGLAAAPQTEQHSVQ